MKNARFLHKWDGRFRVRDIGIGEVGRAVLPVSKAAEVFCQRWTPMIFRELLVGSSWSTRPAEACRHAHLRSASNGYTPRSTIRATAEPKSRETSSARRRRDTEKTQVPRPSGSVPGRFPWDLVPNPGGGPIT